MMISSKREIIESVPYANEEELQKVLGLSPELLDENNKLYTVCSEKNELSIPAGKIDLFMISETGDVIVVETKLARNRESRREVVAQIIDYISSLSEMSFYELDLATKNLLGEVIDNIESEINLPKVIDDNLRSGRIKLIIAVDESNEDLTRLTQFLSDHTRFAIELIEIRKYRDGERELYVSTEIVKSSEMDESNRILGEKRNENAALLDKIVSKWNESHPENMVSSSRSTVYKQVRIKSLPNQCHYEFYMDRKGEGIYIRFDNELTADIKLSGQITGVLRQFGNKKITTRKGTYDIIFKESRSSKYPTSKMFVQIYNMDDIDEIINVMNKFMKLTSEKIINSYMAK